MTYLTRQAVRNGAKLPDLPLAEPSRARVTKKRSPQSRRTSSAPEKVRFTRAKMNQKEIYRDRQHLKGSEGLLTD